MQVKKVAKRKQNGGAIFKVMASGGFGDKSSPVCPLSVSNWHPESGLCPLVHLQHPPSSASEPSPFPVQHSLAPEPGPHCSPHPGWPEEFRREGGKKAHNTPGERRPCPAISGTVGSPGARGQKDGVGNPICFCPFPFLLPCIFHYPTLKTAPQSLHIPRNIHLINRS